MACPLGVRHEGSHASFIRLGLDTEGDLERLEGGSRARKAEFVAPVDDEPYLGLGPGDGDVVEVREPRQLGEESGGDAGGHVLERRGVSPTTTSDRRFVGSEREGAGTHLNFGVGHDVGHDAGDGCGRRSLFGTPSVLLVDEAHALKVHDGLPRLTVVHAFVHGTVSLPIFQWVRISPARTVPFHPRTTIESCKQVW